MSLVEVLCHKRTAYVVPTFNGEVIAIEGQVGAGKTTLFESQLETSGTVGIQEYREYILRRMPQLHSFPPQSEDEAQHNFNTFLGLERDRKNDLYTASPDTQRALLDRSVFTLAAFELGASRLTGINIFEWSLRRIQAEMDEVIFPDKIVYLHIPPLLGQRRIFDAGMRTAPFLINPEFNAGFREAFDIISQEFPGLVHFIDAAQEPTTVARAFRRICEM